MPALIILLAIALWQPSAGAQPSSPEQLIDQYTATGDMTLLERCRLQVADLPGSPRARLLTARLLLLSGDAKGSLAAASELNREIPDELDPYALIVDASLLLGDIPRAEAAGQWMLNLRGEDVRSLMRAAAVREAIRDYDGAGQMLTDALARTARSDIALRASLGVSLARLRMRQARPADAVRLLSQVEAVIPGYQPATLLKRELENKQ